MSTVLWNYPWLHVGAPEMLLIALDQFGSLHTQSSRSQLFADWAAEVALTDPATSADEIPWSGLFLAVCAKREAEVSPDQPRMYSETELKALIAEAVAK